MGAELQHNELTDVVLCYQSMGIPLDASPAAIEQTFRTLSEECKKKLASPDPVLKEEARVSLELMGEMYQKIRGSITYQAVAKDYEKKLAHQGSHTAAKSERPVHKAVAEKQQKINCPRCNGLIDKDLATCPICRSHIPTVWEQIVAEFFTPKKIVIYLVILALAALGALRMANPDLFGAQPPAKAAAPFGSE